MWSSHLFIYSCVHQTVHNGTSAIIFICIELMAAHVFRNGNRISAYSDTEIVFSPAPPKTDEILRIMWLKAGSSCCIWCSHGGGDEHFLGYKPCRPKKVSRRFRVTFRLHLQGRKVSKARNQHVASRTNHVLCLVCSLLLVLFLKERPRESWLLSYK
jgi:hypothetical protein